MWLVSTAHELAAIKEIEEAPDRTIGIVAGAIIASKLSDVLRRALGDDSRYAKKVRNQMFEHEGPLGSFGAHIHMAYLIGLLSEQGHTDLQTLKKIRNLFAHYAEHNTFETERIRALCKNFRLVDDKDRVFERAILKRDTPEKTFEVSLDAVTNVEGIVALAIKKEGDDTESPKWRFLTSSKLFCATLDYYWTEPKAVRVPLL